MMCMTENVFKYIYIYIYTYIYIYIHIYICIDICRLAFLDSRFLHLPDLPLLTGNDYSWHARPFNEVRIKGFTDWIFGCSKMFNLLDSSPAESFPDMIMWSLAESLKLLARYIIMHYQ